MILSKAARAFRRNRDYLEICRFGEKVVNAIKKNRSLRSRGWKSNFSKYATRSTDKGKILARYRNKFKS